MMAAVRGHAIWAALFTAAVAPAAAAFAPYRTTDAETADPWVLEGRLGLIRIIRDEGENEYVSPILRVNLGLPLRLELISEFEYLPEHRRVGDAAIGLKWVPYLEQLSLGIETLALLPISEAGGAGVESNLLVTQRLDPVRIHLNFGGFYDARPEPREKGWRAGLLSEIRVGRVRPGVELFALRVISEPVAVQAGLGLIVDLGPLALRAGVHAGLSDVAPDLTTSFWISSEWP
jgi:hypothetical protein